MRHRHVTSSGYQAGPGPAPTITCVRGCGVLSLSLDSRFTKLVAGDESKVVSIWEMPKQITATGALDYASSRPIRFRTASTIHSVALNGAGDKLAVGTSDHTEIFQMTSQQSSRSYGRGGTATFFCEPLLVLDCPATQGGVAFSSRSHLAIVGNHMVNVFDLQTGGTILKMERSSRMRAAAAAAQDRIEQSAVSEDHVAGAVARCISITRNRFEASCECRAERAQSQQFALHADLRLCGVDRQ